MTSTEVRRPAAPSTAADNLAADPGSLLAAAAVAARCSHLAAAAVVVPDGVEAVEVVVVR